MNTFGKLFRLTSFGESHGLAIGGVIDGIPAGVNVNEAFIKRELERRMPGRSAFTSPRKESDKLRILSGVFEGRTLGTPIGFYVENTNQRSSDYRKVFRPSHADLAYYEKYRGNWDYRGGGRASARETVSRVVAGAFAKLALGQLVPQITIKAYLSSVGSEEIPYDYQCLNLDNIELSEIFCPDKGYEAEFKQLIIDARKHRDTLGSGVTCVISGVPKNLGEPIFGKAHQLFSSAMMSIPGAKGFEYGMGISGCHKYGTAMVDEYTEPWLSLRSNHSGGIQGGITNGDDIYFTVWFKPIATMVGRTLNVGVIDNGDLKVEEVEMRGRHDVCIGPRAVPVVEAMAAITLLDLYLQQASNLSIPK